MAADLHSLNCLTHRLEMLPLADYGPAAEKFPNIFCFHNFNDGSERNSGYLSTTTRGGAGNNRSFYEHNFINENNAGRGRSHETIIKRQHSERRFGNNPAAISFDNCTGLDEESRDVPSSISTKDLQEIQSNARNKRKRSTEVTESLTNSRNCNCDEEIRELGLKDISEQVKLDTDNIASITSGNLSSPYFKRSCTSQPGHKRPKNRPALNFDIMQRRASSSTSWLPFKMKSSEKRVKIIRVTPINLRNSSLTNMCDGKLREEAYFRPISLDEG